ncbi:glycine/D-amino acid oxidase-like deaminating enzyme [Sphaerotilus hippei]|uniref:Glycine/D-amino acid oxidase-like deaminating enzyme n=1 Tax=Sphaerotilus hippei TaxID=744406 RepID=A0A318HCF0_9BURK|nr:FAD-dependent oxidoreductase [Sphaerotilus hippei]PXW98645.1 glycine/D-amino acid oxidase-like deaminating enzyme [Sphaerotilus hippei]
MRIAVIGAGVVGVCTTWELADDGHDVHCFDRHDSVAAQSSFAHTGLLGTLAPSFMPPPRHGATTALKEWRWLRAHRRSGRTTTPADLQALHQLGAASRQHLDHLCRRLDIQIERSQGTLVLLHDAAQLDEAAARLPTWQQAGLTARLVDAEACQALEPGLGGDPQTRDRPLELAGGLHLPDEGAGNCRQFAQQLRDRAERQHGAQFHFGISVQQLASSGGRPLLTLHRPADRPATEALAGDAPDRHAPGPAPFADTATLPRTWQEDFDAVVLCTGASGGLTARMPQTLPLRAVWGHTITFRLHPQGLPIRSAVVDAQTGVTITRLGDRLRVAGTHRLTPADATPPAAGDAALQALYQAVERWFPSAIQRADSQVWTGARACLPGPLPTIGASAQAGIWLNMGHGGAGWALACGSARRLADLVAASATSATPVTATAPLVATDRMNA